MPNDPSQQDILFPRLGLRLCIERQAGTAVSISVATAAGEPINNDTVGDWINEATASRLATDKTSRHQARNRMNGVALGLQVVSRKIATGKTDNVETLVGAVINELNALECLLPPVGPKDA